MVINCDVELAPGAPLVLLAKTDIPLALAIYFEAGTVYQQMNWPVD